MSVIPTPVSLEGRVQMEQTATLVCAPRDIMATTVRQRLTIAWPDRVGLVPRVYDLLVVIVVPADRDIQDKTALRL
jgi:hypothetical protein